MDRSRRSIRGEAKGIIVPIAILVILASIFFIVRYIRGADDRQFGYADYRPGLDAEIGERLGEALAEAMGGSGQAVVIGGVQLTDKPNERSQTRAAAAAAALEAGGVTVVGTVVPTADELRDQFAWPGSMTEGISAPYVASLAQQFPGIKGIVSIPGYPTTNINALGPLATAGVKMAAFDEGSLARYEALFSNRMMVAVVTADRESEYIESDFDDLENQAQEAFDKMYLLKTR